MNPTLLIDAARAIAHSVLTNTPMSPELFAIALLLAIPAVIIGWAGFLALQEASVWAIGWIRRRLDAFLTARGY